MTASSFDSRIAKRLSATFAGNSKLLNAYLLVHSDTLGLHAALAHGQTDGRPATPDQPYHTASLAKTFTAVVIAMLAEEGKLRFDDAIATYLPEDLMQGLHVEKGRDASREIRIAHLLGHTSGLADYYEQKVDGKSFMERILDEPERVWTPEETIEWTKRHLKPRFAPGKGSHYTDTGYNLLGLIIEAVTGRPYHEAVHAYLFDRLGMRQTYLPSYSSPAARSPLPVANIEAMGRVVRVEAYQSLTSNFAAGQAVSTSEDLLIFMKALVEGRLLKPETLAEMQTWTKLWIGVDYGYGLMRVRLLPFVRKYIGWGHLGSIGAFMLYFPALDVHLIGNFNRAGHVGPSMRFAFGVLREVAKLRPQAVRRPV